MNARSPLAHVRSRILDPVKRAVALMLTAVWETWTLFVRNPTFRFVFTLMISIAILGAIVLTLIERRSGAESHITGLSDAIWWAFVTMTTVGYGDLYPTTTAGRVVAVLMMFAGIALTSLFTATVASIFVARHLKEARGLERIRWQGHTLICGWNHDAEKVIIGLIQGGRNRIVLVNELSEEQVAETMERHGDRLKFVRGNPCHESVLERANVRAAEAAIVLADTVSGTTANADERTILATLAIKTMEPHVVTCAELLNRENEQHLQRAEVDDVIVSGEMSGLLLASAIAARGVPQVVHELLSADFGNSYHRTDIPGELVGKTWHEVSEYFRIEHHAILIAVVSEDIGIEVDDILGQEDSAIDAFIRQKFSEAEKDVFGDAKQKVSTAINPDDDYEIQPQDKAIVISTAPIEV